MARSGGMVAVTAPPGSTVSMRYPSYGPGSRWKYHHGMPFCAAMTAVCSVVSGARIGPQLA